MAERRLAAALALAAALSADGAGAQGAGSAGAELLQVAAGARAAALGGAYTAARGDPDGVFYNPASAASLRGGAGLGYQAHVQDVSLGSFSGVLAAGPVAIGAGLLFLDAGTVEEIVPDPAYGGERGRGTGEQVGATEAAGRIAAALPLAGGRVAAGVALGLVTSDLAGVSRRGVFADAGLQAILGGGLEVGAALRHLGTAMSAETLGDAPLPSQARLGATYRRGWGPRYAAVAFMDGIWGIAEGTTGLALGVEGGLLPAAGPLSAVLRGGVHLGEGEGHLGRVRFGAGVALGHLALDYGVQSFRYLGTIHRVGLRWAR